MKSTILLSIVSLVLLFSVKGQRVGISTPAPTHDLHLLHSSGAGSSNNSQGLKIQNVGSSNSSWTLYTVNNGGELWIYSGITNVGRFAVTGVYTVISDARVKNNIQEVDDVLHKVMLLEPKKYRYNHQSALDSLSLGFIAQSVLPVFPELVNESKSDDNQISYAIDYAGFSVVAIKAIQEQQKQIEEQRLLLQEMSLELARVKTALGL